MTRPLSKSAKEPVVVHGMPMGSGKANTLAATGQSFEIHEGSGSGLSYLHVHHGDDQAWYVLEGILTFRFLDRTVEASAGTTVFVPAGVPHSFVEAHGPTRYLLILTPRLQELFCELETTPPDQHAAILRWFDSEALEHPAAMMVDKVSG